mgnify:CR=1 FL=1
MDYEEAIAIWDKMAKTRYTDEEIKAHIENATYVIGGELASAEALVALAMTAYNKMINDRIINAKNSWGLK